MASIQKGRKQNIWKRWQSVVSTIKNECSSFSEFYEFSDVWFNWISCRFKWILHRRLVWHTSRDGLLFRILCEISHQSNFSLFDIFTLTNLNNHDNILLIPKSFTSLHSFTKLPLLEPTTITSSVLIENYLNGTICNAC